ncbi:MAG TPA: hypothetical protein VJ644_04795 [Jiangellaceae bacterium]|nr:hypothetical protein [Jiangellaceae bacterium]
MSLHTTPQSYLARLGARVAIDGISAHSADVLGLARAALAVAPAAAAVLGDSGQPEVARQRALAVASSAVLRNRAAAESLDALAGVVERDLQPTAA